MSLFNKVDKEGQKLEKKRLILNAFGFILVGALFFAAKIILELEIENQQLVNTLFINISNKICEDIGIVLLAVGIGTIGFEYFGFIKYAKERLKDVVIEHDFLSKLQIQ